MPTVSAPDSYDGERNIAPQECSIPQTYLMLLVLSDESQFAVGSEPKLGIYVDTVISNGNLTLDRLARGGLQRSHARAGRWKLQGNLKRW